MKQITKKLKLVMACTLMSLSLSSQGDDDFGQLFDRWYSSSQSGVSAVQFQQYKNVCGQCHFPYQPGLLPAMSWEKIMMNTNKHFGQPLSLSEVEQRTMMRYLLDNSAGHVNDEISNRILQSLKYNPIPIRITETPYWIYEHKKLDGEQVKQKAYQCNHCHQDADKGKYDTYLERHSMYNLTPGSHYGLKM